MLKALESTGFRCNKQLSEFLSQDQNTTSKLGFCPTTEFNVLRGIGSGGEGLVLQCSFPQRSDPVALKLFFKGQKPSNQHLWPLRDEALYYASCARYKAQFSDAPHTLPPLPKLPYTEWTQRNDQLSDKELFNVISRDVSEAQPEAAERDKILPLLDKMCADGWVAFGMDIRHKLRKFLTPQENDRLAQFTGDVIIGIVKPFFGSEISGGESLERQMRTMLLMRTFGWRLKEFQDRNWINGYLVDGGDVDVYPKHRRYIERSWSSAFFQVIKQRKGRAQTDEGCVEDEQ